LVGDFAAVEEPALGFGAAGAVEVEGCEAGWWSGVGCEGGEDVGVWASDRVLEASVEGVALWEERLEDGEEGRAVCGMGVGCWWGCHCGDNVRLCLKKLAVFTFSLGQVE